MTHACDRPPAQRRVSRTDLISADRRRDSRVQSAEVVFFCIAITCAGTACSDAVHSPDGALLGATDASLQFIDARLDNSGTAYADASRDSLNLDASSAAPDSKPADAMAASDAHQPPDSAIVDTGFPGPDAIPVIDAAPNTRPDAFVCDPHTISHDNDSWLGSAAFGTRTAIPPLVGDGQSVQANADYQAATFSFYFNQCSGRTTLVLNVRDRFGVSEQHAETIVPDGFSEGWVTWNIDLFMPQGVTFIFTAYPKAADGVYCSIRGDVDQGYPTGVRYHSFQTDPSGFEDFAHWAITDWDLWFKLEGCAWVLPGG